MQGVIYKGIGGFYYVRADDGRMLECRARGIFRKRGEKPVAGDRVRLGAPDFDASGGSAEPNTANPPHSEAPREVPRTEACKAKHNAVVRSEKGCQGMERSDAAGGAYTIDEILPRKNLLVRPPVANVDRLFIVASTTEPAPSFLVIDKLAAVALDQEIEPVLVVTKPDLASPDALAEAYRTSGIPVLVVCVAEDAPGPEAGLDAVRRLLPGALSVFCGNSGVGKSTLLNALMPALGREVGEISQKLGRGRHTTREVELFEVEAPGARGAGKAAGDMGLVADTPGFASFDVQSAGEILADNLQLCFPEIKSRIGQCKFSGCTHLAEKGCAVRAAVQAGEMAPNRYDSYTALYREAKEAENRY